MSVSQKCLPPLSPEQKQWLQNTDFAAKLLRWYDDHHRSLPWRTTKDPYKIWLSEIILQQTRVAQGMAYYDRIVAAFPTVTSLAASSEQAVLRLWQGLGYYRRALNLHACARKIVADYDGVFPSTYKELCTLPGIGPYTAAAIASIAFDQRVAVVDGNVYRVLARIFGIDENIALPPAQKLFQGLAHELLPTARIGDYNQAVMELGALVCKPAKPDCASCIFQSHCVAYREKKQDLLPIKEKNIKIKHRFFHYLVLQRGNQFYLQRRTKKDIWKGLYQFYLIEENDAKELNGIDNPMVNMLKKHGVTWRQDPMVYQHQLTHQRLHISFFYVIIEDWLFPHVAPLLEKEALNGFSLEEVQGLPLPITLARFVEKMITY